MAAEHGRRPPVPLGFESLTPGARANIQAYAETTFGEGVSLDSLTLAQLEKLRNEVFGSGTSLSFCIPDRGTAIRSALTQRIKTLLDAARHTGNLMHGLDAGDVDGELETIRTSLSGLKANSNPEDDFPF